MAEPADMFAAFFGVGDFAAGAAKTDRSGGRRKKPASIRNSEVLPAPLGPSITSALPASMRKFRFLKSARLPAHASEVRGLYACERGLTRIYPAMYCAPFTVMVAPVMKAASSLARNAVILAISSALPRRPTGIVAMMLSSTFGGTACTISVSI